MYFIVIVAVAGALDAVASSSCCDTILGTAWLNQLATTTSLVCSSTSGSGTFTNVVAHYVDTLDRRTVFVDAHNVLVDTTRMHWPPNQPSSNSEANEYFTPFSPGTFHGNCVLAPEQLDRVKTIATTTHPRLSLLLQLNSFTAAYDEPLKCTRWRHAPVLLLERIEYANLYHTLTEWFNAYTVLRAVSLLESNEWSLELFDAHRDGALDEPWQRLFRARRFHENVVDGERLCYTRLLLGAPGYLSRFSHYTGQQETCTDCRLLADFRHWLLAQYMTTPSPWRTRTTAPRVTLVVRRPYVAHPRNPSGRVVRRWTNETQLLADIASRVAARAQAVDWAEHSFAEQLNIVVDTDILVGVHGAGLSHVVFMTRPGATLIEAAWGQRCFANLATMANVAYEKVPVREQGEFVVADHDAIVHAIARAINRLNEHQQ